MADVAPKFDTLASSHAYVIENGMRPGDDPFQILQTLSGELTDLPRASAQMTETTRLIAALSDLISARELTAWLQTANPGFDGCTPWELIEAGELDLLWEMVHQTRHGALA